MRLLNSEHATGGGSELQDVVFTNFQGVLQVQPNDHETRRLVSLLRANTSIPALMAWCRSQGLVRNRNGRFILRMRGYSQWALGNWSHFLFGIELQEIAELATALLTYNKERKNVTEHG